MLTDETPPGQTPPGQTRLRLLIAAALLGSIAVIGALVALPSAERHDLGVAAGTASVDVSAPPAVAAMAVTPSPSLPIPDPLPVDPRAPTDDIVVGHIAIPKIGVDEDIRRGITLTNIDRGPGWWPNTAMPGELGNVVLAGHRVTHTKPFNRLDELVEGDQVVLTTDAGRFTYAVRGVIVVPADWIDIAAQDRAHTATLFACHPKGSATHRIVAKLRLLDDAGNPVDPDSSLPAMDAEEVRTDHTLIVRQTPGDPPTASGDPLAGIDG